VDVSVGDGLGVSVGGGLGVGDSRTKAVGVMLAVIVELAEDAAEPSGAGVTIKGVPVTRPLCTKELIHASPTIKKGNTTPITTSDTSKQLQLGWLSAPRKPPPDMMSSGSGRILRGTAPPHGLTADVGEGSTGVDVSVGDGLGVSVGGGLGVSLGVGVKVGVTVGVAEGAGE
jgi:hypothetical protein